MLCSFNFLGCIASPVIYAIPRDVLTSGEIYAPDHGTEAILDWTIYFTQLQVSLLASLLLFSFIMVTSFFILNKYWSLFFPNGDGFEEQWAFKCKINLQFPYLIWNLPSYFPTLPFLTPFLALTGRSKTFSGL